MGGEDGSGLVRLYYLLFLPSILLGLVNLVRWFQDYAERKDGFNEHRS